MNYSEYSEAARFFNIISMGFLPIIGFPRAGGTLKVNGDVEIYDENGDFVYYQTLTSQVNWVKTLYFKKSPLSIT